MTIDERIRWYFVHGGFDRKRHIEAQWDDSIYTWDRDLWGAAVGWEHSTKEHEFRIKGKPERVFIGHTPVQMYKRTTPMTCAQITNLDTGSGKGGLLTIYNLITNQFYQA